MYVLQVGVTGGEKYNFDLCDFFRVWRAGLCSCALVQGAGHARVPVAGFTCDRSCMGPPVIESVSGIRTRGVRTRTGMVERRDNKSAYLSCTFATLFVDAKGTRS